MKMNQLARSSKQLGAALRRRRRALGLTQAALGARAQLRQATVSAVETGEASLQLSTLLDLLAALDLELVIRDRTSADISSIGDHY